MFGIGNIHDDAFPTERKALAEVLSIVHPQTQPAQSTPRGGTSPPGPSTLSMSGGAAQGGGICAK